MQLAHIAYAHVIRGSGAPRTTVARLHHYKDFGKYPDELKGFTCKENLDTGVFQQRFHACSVKLALYIAGELKGLMACKWGRRDDKTRPLIIDAFCANGGGAKLVRELQTADADTQRLLVGHPYDAIELQSHPNALRFWGKCGFTFNDRNELFSLSWTRRPHAGKLRTSGRSKSNARSNVGNTRISTVPSTARMPNAGRTRISGIPSNAEPTKRASNASKGPPLQPD